VADVLEAMLVVAKVELADVEALLARKDVAPPLAAHAVRHHYRGVVYALEVSLERAR
jgi:hypothetical protein